MSQHPDITVRQIASDDELSACLDIRRVVFIDEQGVSEAEEMDGKEHICDHLIALDGDEAVATSRLNWLDGTKLKIQRVAVLKPYRGSGIGLKMIREAIRIGSERPGIGMVILEAQVSAIGFYEKIGFVAEGPVFMDAGIEHRLMTLPLD